MFRSSARAGDVVRQRRPGTRFIPLFAAALLAVGCASTRPRIEPPNVTLESVRIVRIVDAKATLLLNLQVTNPNSFDIAIDALDFEVTLDARPAASGRSAHIDPLPAGGEAKVEIAGSVDFAAVATALMAFGSRLPVDYTVKGTAMLHDGNVLAFARKGEISVARPR